MTIKTYFTIISVIGIIFGVGFLLAPGQLGLIYSVKESPDVELAHRFFGGALLAWALTHLIHQGSFLRLASVA